MRIFNCWTKIGGFRTFSLLNIWYGPQCFGITILNIGVEFRVHESKEAPLHVKGLDHAAR
jgi:hypothetical protein